MRWLVLAGGILAGCTAQGAQFRDAALERGADAADQGLINAEIYMCRVSPVGAVKRRYNTPGKATAYNTLCDEGGGENIITGQ